MVSIGIQTHDARAEMAASLLDCLGGRADLVFDPSPAGPPSAWRTYREVLERTPARADARLVLQDDALVCDGFVDAVEAAARAQPGRVIVFFVAGHPLNHKRTVLRACEADRTFAELDLSTWIPVVATLWPIELIPRLLAFYDEKLESRKWPPAFVADDEICGHFLRAAEHYPLATVPSLVEHPDTVPSIIHGARRRADGRDPGRRAACWIGDCGYCDARLIDWTIEPYRGATVGNPFTG